MPEFHLVYRSINKPLTILGAERRLFFLALVMAGATFNFFGSLAASILMYVALYAAARWVTAVDPEMLRILFNSSRFKVRYDPGRFEPVRVVRIP